jgi:hypothetical protein
LRKAFDSFGDFSGMVVSFRWIVARKSDEFEGLVGTWLELRLNPGAPPCENSSKSEAIGQVESFLCEPSDAARATISVLYFV